MLFDVFSSIISGILISFGGLLFICSKWIYKSELFDFIGSILFSIGLLIICKCKFLLFTGKVGFMFEYNNEWSKKYCSSWFKLLLILILNISSAIGFGILTNLSFRKLQVMNIISSIVSNKIKLSMFDDYVKCFLQSIFCGSCVHFAVKSFSYNCIFCVLFISCFVYNGFQHCIANAFYFAATFNFDVKMLINEAVVITGNIIGTIPVAGLFNLLSETKTEDTDSGMDDII